MCFYRKYIEDLFDFSNSQLLEFLTSFFLRLRALAPPVALGNSNNSSKLISLSQKMKLSLQRSTFFSESQSSFHFSMFSLSLFTVRENVEEEALYRGRADQISIFFCQYLLRCKKFLIEQYQLCRQSISYTCTHFQPESLFIVHCSLFTIHCSLGSLAVHFKVIYTIPIVRGEA